MLDKIALIQQILSESSIDGWLIYDFHKRNALAMDFLEIPHSLFLTRRFFYWIPQKGAPIKIVNAIESHVLDFLPGEKVTYFTWKTWEEQLKKVLEGKRRIAMEYSPQNRIPSISLVDGGTLELVLQFVPEVVSSGDFIQQFTCVLTPPQRKSHLEAAFVLEEVVDRAWDFLSGCLKRKEKVTEFDVQQKMESDMKKRGCSFEGNPICAINQNSSNPHYIPEKKTSLEIKQGDFVLLDLWCKKNEVFSVYADICRVAVADFSPTPRQELIFGIVREAQKKATEFIRNRCLRGEEIRGWEVDQEARQVIEQAGFGPYFIHRTGHNIYTQDHGPGTHMDSLETFDDRKVLFETCFSIEPGIYLPKEFGVRLEYDLFITKQGDLEVSGGEQTEIKVLF